MTKPIGYYVSDHADVEKMSEICRAYGDHLEELDRDQKITLLKLIAHELWERPKIPFNVPASLQLKLDSLSDSSLLSLAAATLEQLRHDK